MAPLCNLKLELLDEDGRRLQGDLYAKVVDTSDAAGGGFRIRFTGVDPALDELLGVLRATHAGS